jgi:hypothetical protein
VSVPPLDDDELVDDVELVDEELVLLVELVDDVLEEDQELVVDEVDDELDEDPFVPPPPFDVVAVLVELVDETVAVGLVVSPPRPPPEVVAVGAPPCPVDASAVPPAPAGPFTRSGP